jgi:hypothetical protein
MSIFRIRLVVQNYIGWQGHFGNSDSEIQLMLRRLIEWFRGEPAPMHRTTTQLRRRSSAHAALRDATERTGQAELTPGFFESGQSISGHVESTGPGKNVLIRNKYNRDDTGTHETLMILDDSFVDDSEEDGIDPYNSGEFDRSKHWDKRFRS